MVNGSYKLPASDEWDKSRKRDKCVHEIDF